MIVVGSKTVMSANMPAFNNPRPAIPTRCAASEVIFLIANSSVITESCLT